MRSTRTLSMLSLGAVLWIGGSTVMNTAMAHGDGDPYTAHYMWRRYFNTTVNCPTDGTTPNATNAPEYACTGVIFRVTTPAKEPDGAWIPEAKSYNDSGKRSMGGVSFSYIRADSKFDRGAWGATNGFTLFPSDGKYKQPPGKMKLTVLCAFPIDAATDNRNDAGCNLTNKTNPPGAGYCADNGITNLSQWEAAFGPPNKTDKQAEDWGWTKQCGWNMRDGKRLKTDFTTVLQAKAYSNTFDTVNELRIQTWAPNMAIGKSEQTALSLPIESFFYFKGAKVTAADSAQGMKNAQSDQKKFFDLTGTFVPIVRITLPSSPAADWDFSYQKEDQSPGVTIPVFKKSDEIPCTKGTFDTKC